MAELRPLTARDIKSNVEGYQEMSDEAFARRFYSDRAELLAGSACRSSRSATSSPARSSTRSARSATSCRRSTSTTTSSPRSRPASTCSRAASPTPSRCGSRSRTSRSAARRACSSRAPTATAVRVEVRDPDYTPELQGRLGKLEAAISKQRTVRFQLLVDRPRRGARADDQPLRAPARERHLVRDRPRPRATRSSRASASRGSAPRSASRPAASATSASRRASTSRSSAAAPTGSSARSLGEARIEVAPDTAWWVQREYAEPRNRVEDGVFVTEYASLPLLARWILRQEGRAVPLEPSALRRLVTEGVRAVAARARGRGRRCRRAEQRVAVARAAPPSARPGPVAPERFGVLQSLLAYLLAACGEERGRRHPRRRADRALLDPRRGARGAPLAAQPRQLRRRLLRGLRRAARRRGARRQGALRRHLPPRRRG